LFTSHDRHFMQRVATAVIEVRDGRITNYPAGYETYVYRISKELEEGERSQPDASGAATTHPDAKAPRRAKDQRHDRELRKAIAALERKIARLDERRRHAHHRLMESTDPEAAEALHEEVNQIAGELSSHETRWFELQEQMESDV
jgi:ATPase subunit of ABC transporter with duplicated ATPase domains